MRFLKVGHFLGECIICIAIYRNRRYSIVLQELSLKSLEREFEVCKDFDRRRQMRATMKDLRTKIRGKPPPKIPFLKLLNAFYHAF